MNEVATCRTVRDVVGPDGPICPKLRAVVGPPGPFVEIVLDGEPERSPANLELITDEVVAAVKAIWNQEHPPVPRVPLPYVPPRIRIVALDGERAGQFVEGLLALHLSLSGGG